MKRNPLLAVFITIFVDLMGVGILIPVIPALLADPSSPYYLLPAGASLQHGFILLGFLTAIYPFMVFLAAPILGQLSDRYGRRPVLMISLAGTMLSYLVFAYGILTRNLTLLFISRAFDGITGGNISVAQAAIADVTKPEDRAKNFGLIGAAFGLGFILGPFLGGVLSDSSHGSWFNATTPFWFAAGLTLVNIASVYLFLPETHVNPVRDRVIEWGRSIHNIVRAFSLTSVRPLFLTSFLFTGGFTFFTTFFSVFLIERFGYSQGQIGNYFAYVGIWIAFTQAVVTRRLAGKYSETAILRVALIVTSVLVAAFFLPNAPWQLYLLTPFFAIFNGLVQANLPALVSRSVGQEVQGEILGINMSLAALAQAIPPVLSGFIAASLTPTAPILVASVVMGLSGVLFIAMSRKSAKVSS